MFSLVYIDTPFCNATIHKKSVFVLIMHLKFHIFYMVIAAHRFSCKVSTTNGNWPKQQSIMIKYKNVFNNTN